MEMRIEEMTREELADELMKYWDKFFNLKHDYERLRKEKSGSLKFPDEPIKVADMLISATETYYGLFGEVNDALKYSVSDLEQIAYHLLIYADAKREEETETSECGDE